MTARQVTLKPRHWAGFFDGDEVWDGPDYMGLVGRYDNEYDQPIRYRAYGTRLGVDGEPVAVEAEFPTQDEAVTWLVEVES
jgi:hypothetical protein